MAIISGIVLPDELYYHRKDHIWARPEEGKVRLGLDSFLRCAVGEIVYLRVHPAGRRLRKEQTMGSFEAERCVGVLRAPLSGTVLEVNEAILDDPEQLWTDAYGEGWLLLVEPESWEEDCRDLLHGKGPVLEWLRSEFRNHRARGEIFPCWNQPD